MCKCVSVSFVGSRVWIQIWAWNFLSLFCCVLCIGNGLCDELVTYSESCRVCMCVCVSNCVCDLGTTTNSHSSPQFAAAPQKESNINFTYRYWNSNRRLLPATRQCDCFSRVDPFIWHISESAVSIASNHILTEIPDMRDSHEALHYASLLHPLW